MKLISGFASWMSVLLVALTLGGDALAYEQPKFDVLEKRGGYEVRRYAPYIVAETVVEGSFKDSGNEAFRILAGYIFGDNRADEKMNMTAPVESRPASDGVKMNMTVPVTSQPSSDGPGRYVYRFVMDQKYTLDTLPQPNDARVRLRKVGGRTVAVKRFSGFWTQANYDDNEEELLQALAHDNMTIAGEPMLARYNGPFTPWFLRRNEVMVDVEWPQSR